MLARLINDAFLVEAFFKIGDRTSAAEIRQMILDGGHFLVLEDPAGTIAGSVYLKFDIDRAYFGMLSVAPSRQGEGLGRRLIDAVEARCRDHGCRYVDIHIVNLREELPAFYRRLGYVETGTFVHGHGPVDAPVPLHRHDEASRVITDAFLNPARRCATLPVKGVRP